MAPDVWGWRGRGDSCGAASPNTKMLAGRNAVGGPSTRGAVWGSTQTALLGSLLAHSRSWEDLPCCPVESIKELFMSHLGWRSSSQGNVCAQSCIFALLSPKSGRAADHNSCGELEFPEAPDRVANHIWEENLSVFFTSCHRKISAGGMLPGPCIPQPETVQPRPAPRASLAQGFGLLSLVAMPLPKAMVIPPAVTPPRGCLNW